MCRRHVNDSVAVENLDGGNVFCRNRQGDIKDGSGCRTDLARDGMCRERVKTRVVGRDMFVCRKDNYRRI